MKSNYLEELNIDIHDRVAEAYYGKMGDKLMKDTQYRIHWVCNNVNGKRILDVGCSQGIAPILLGREGKSVSGLDISQKAIDEANVALEKEEVDIRENVTFSRANFLLHNFKDEKFDSIIIAEVLEHLVNPQDFIEKAKDILTNNGTLIITVPFGINDHIDHKQTFYLFDIYRMLYKYFDISDISILGKWIGFIAIKRPDLATKSLEQIDVAQIKKMEEAFYDIERDLVENNKERFEKNNLLHEKLQDANLKYRNVLNEMNQNNKKLNTQHKIQLTEVNKKNTELDKKNTEVNKKNTELDKKNTELDKKNTEVNKKNTELDKKNTELDKKNTEVDKKNTELDKKNTELDKKNTELDKKYTELDKKYTELDKKYKIQLTELDKKMKKLDLDKERQLQSFLESRQSASFRLGHLLIHETRSFTDIIKLPKRINDIRKKKLN